MDEYNVEESPVATLTGERQLPDGTLLTWNIERASATARVTLRRGGQTLIALETSALYRTPPGEAGALRLHADLQGRPGGSGRLDATVQLDVGRVFKARLAAWSATRSLHATATGAAVAASEHFDWPLAEPAAVAYAEASSRDQATTHTAGTPPAHEPSDLPSEGPSSPPARPRGRRASTGTGREGA